MLPAAVGLVAGLALLIRAGDEFVVSSARLARRFGIRPVVIGAVVIGFGTSVPELVVAGIASATGSPQLAVGSLVGSNIANLSLILGLATVVAPIHVDSRTVRREAPLSVAAVLLFAIVLVGGLSRADGAALGAALLVAVAVLLVNARHGRPLDELEVETEEFTRPVAGPRRAEVFRTVVALVLVLLGAELMVRSATSLAIRLGLTEGFVGLTIVALGTSSPELVTAVQASRRHDPDLVAGNLLGSNVFNSLAGGAVAALAWTGAAGAAGVGFVPVWVMVGVAFAAWAFMARGSLVNRWEAAALIAAYVGMLPFVVR